MEAFWLLYIKCFTLFFYVCILYVLSVVFLFSCHDVKDVGGGEATSVHLYQVHLLKKKFFGCSIYLVLLFRTFFFFFAVLPVGFPLP